MGPFLFIMAVPPKEHKTLDHMQFLLLLETMLICFSSRVFCPTSLECFEHLFPAIATSTHTLGGPIGRRTRGTRGPCLAGPCGGGSSGLGGGPGRWLEQEKSGNQPRKS